MYNCFFDETYTPFQANAPMDDVPFEAEDEMDALDDIDFQSMPAETKAQARSTAPRMSRSQPMQDSNAYTTTTPSDVSSLLSQASAQLQSGSRDQDTLLILAIAVFLFSHDGITDWNDVALVAILLFLGL